MQFVSRLIEFATNHYLLVAALLVLLVLLLLHELRKGGKSLSTRELTALVNADQAVVLDIRPAKEFASGHIVDALNIPADKLNSRMTELEKYKGKTIILVDAMGQHSGTWGGVLKKAGFNAAKLSGGIGSWRGDNHLHHRLVSVLHPRQAVAATQGRGLPGDRLRRQARTARRAGTQGGIDHRAADLDRRDPCRRLRRPSCTGARRQAGRAAVCLKPFMN